MIVAALRKEGVEAAVNPDRLDPARGYWRTDPRADVMRWEGDIRVKVNGSWVTLAVGSWDTMTDCVRNGLAASINRQFVEVSAHA